MLQRHQFQSKIITLICIVNAANSAFRYGMFYKAQALATLKPDSLYSIPAKSKIDCSTMCVDRDTCSCFTFDKQLQICDMGNCIAANSTPVTPTQFYVSFDSNDDFIVLTYGSITACVWMSSEQTDFITAREDCKAKSSHLFTLKSFDKLRLLQKYYGTIDFWVGLDDMEVEETFRWVDDNSVCAEPLMRQLFDSDQPDDAWLSQDCVRYRALHSNLDDVNCILNMKYLCEKPFYNLF